MIIEREKSRRRILGGHPLERQLPPRGGAASSRQRGQGRLPPDPMRHHRHARGPSDRTLLHLGHFERHGRIHLGPWWHGLHCALKHHRGGVRLSLAQRGHNHLHRRYATLGRWCRTHCGRSRLLDGHQGRRCRHGRRRVDQRSRSIVATPAQNRSNIRRCRPSHLMGKALLGRQPQRAARPQKSTQRKKA